MSASTSLDSRSDTDPQHDAGTPNSNPATGELIGTSAVDSPDDVRRAVESARRAQPSWAALPVKQRVVVIRRVRDLIADRADQLADVISRNNGKTRIDALATEVLPAALAADYYARRAAGFLKDRKLPAASFLLGNKRSRIHRVPYGVVGVISPWNYPFAIPFSEVVMGLLAGNAVVLKAATQTQMVGRALLQLFRDADLPADVLQYVNLPGPQASDALLAAGIDKLFFTGSVEVGKKLMAQAAATLTPLVLELGGNDPMLVCADAHLERAAAGAVWGGMSNAGQSCGGVERIYVHADVYDEFLRRLGDAVRALRVGRDTGAHDVDLGSMTTAEQARKVQAQVHEAIAQGAVVCAQSSCPAGAAGHFLPAMVLTDVNHSMRLMREETFGPVVGVMKVADMEEAVSLANDSSLGLTASVWSKDRRAAVRLARQIQAGVVTINDHLMSHGLPESPWGGFKQSGIGRTHGRLGFDEMTQPQCIVDDNLGFLRKALWWHPYSPDVYAGLGGLIEFLHGRGCARRISGKIRLLRLLPRTWRG